jgi:CheY-like chemotaxis protein
MPRVLIVEDDKSIREDLAELLRDEGYAVETASNGVEAWEHLVHSPPPCLILLDFMMPVMNGMEFRKKQLADESLCAIPVILLTGIAEPVNVANDLGVAAVIKKPFRLAPLLDTMHRYC